MDGDGGGVAGWQNKLQVAISKVTPRMHAKMAAPGTEERAIIR